MYKENIEQKPLQTDNTGMDYTRCYQQPFVSLYNEDCVETMKRIPDGSIDLMLTDPPYNTTACKWEYAINFEMLWAEWLRMVKPNGAFIFTASQPFTTDLIMSNRKHFKYEWIWEKNKASNIFMVDYAPMKKHENICVFYRKTPVFNPIKVARSESGKQRAKYIHNPSNTGKREYINGFKQEKSIKYNEDEKNPESIIYFNNDVGLHPTQKPLDLMRYLILTYSNKGETVFDGYSGSGTTAEACIIEGRKFIGSELNKEYFDKSVLRLKNVPTQLF